MNTFSSLLPTEDPSIGCYTQQSFYRSSINRTSFFRSSIHKRPATCLLFTESFYRPSIHGRFSTDLQYTEDFQQVFYTQVFYTEVLCEPSRGLLHTDLYFRNRFTPMVQYLALVVLYVLFLGEFLKYFSVQLFVYGSQKHIKKSKL